MKITVKRVIDGNTFYGVVDGEELKFDINVKVESIFEYDDGKMKYQRRTPEHIGYKQKDLLSQYFKNHNSVIETEETPKKNKWGKYIISLPVYERAINTNDFSLINSNPIIVEKIKEVIPKAKPVKLPTETKVEKSTNVKTFILPSEFILLDLETTDLLPENGEIIEIGALLVNGEDFSVIDQFECLIDINLDIPPHITRITGITTELVSREGIKKKKALKKLEKFCSDRVCLAHNASFDKRWVRHHLDSEGIKYTETDWMDTMQIFSSKLPKLENKKLETYIKHYKLADVESHRATDDAKHTLEILKIAMSSNSL